MNERNSEGTLTKVMLGISIAISGVVGLVAALSETPLVDYWPAFGTVAAVILAVGKALDGYSRSRPAKHMAMLSKEESNVLRRAAALAGSPQDVLADPPSGGSDQPKPGSTQPGSP